MYEATPIPTVEHATKQMKSGAVELKDAVVTQSNEMFNRCWDDTESLIRENPYRSVLVAFGLGAIVSLILFRNSK